VAVLPWSLEMHGNKMFSVNCHPYMDFIYKHLPLYTGVGLLSQPPTWKTRAFKVTDKHKPTLQARRKMRKHFNKMLQ